MTDGWGVSAGQRGDSRPGWDRRLTFRHVTQNGSQVQTYTLFISGIFQLVFQSMGDHR